MTNDQQHALVAHREREAFAVEMAGLRRDAERLRFVIKTLDTDGYIYGIDLHEQLKKQEHIDVYAGWISAIDAAMKEVPHA